jgi:alpha-L-rhamnosidase
MIRSRVIAGIAGRGLSCGAAVVAAALVLSLGAASRTAPVRLVDETPVRISTVAPGVTLVDFGRVAFGNLQFLPSPGASGPVTVHFGEALADGRVDRQPPGSVRYAQVQVALSGAPTLVTPLPDARNTRQVGPADKPDANGYITPPAVLTPREWGVVLPFRWVEIEGWPGELAPGQIRRRSAFASAWDDDAASFRSSNDLLDRIWELCRYSIKATTFAGVYVDGDRERIPYEADAYLNQLSHYTTDGDRQMARDTFDWLVRHPTWPTEWRAHLVFMAHADWMDSGDRAWLAARYETIAGKLLLRRARADGLVTSDAATIRQGDLVDWPAGERDGFVFRPVNTVINAFHLRTLAVMAELAAAVGRESDAAAYRSREAAARAVFQAKLFDSARGVYRDGEGTDHASLHANLFPLAFGLVPENQRARVTAWVRSRGMACSVYAAQYLLEALFENDAAEAALALVTAPTDRSWAHMLESGTTITWEAWDQKYKPNQDWNHAWGAAPANLLPRFVLGVRPLAPAWTRALIRPNPGPLTRADGKVPTPRGPIVVRWTRGGGFRLALELPAGVAAHVELPASERSQGVRVGGRPARAHRVNDRWVLDEDVTGVVTVEERLE